MKIVLFSDLHYSPDRIVYGRSSKECLRNAITHVNKHHRDADLCVILGDLTDRGLELEYQSLSTDLENLSIPYRMLLGNHDDRDQFIRVFGKNLLDKHGFVQSAVVVGSHRFLFLDTHMPGQGWGSLDGDRLEWLDQELTRADQPCVVCLHHPPFATALPAYDAIGLQDAGQCAAILDRHRSKVFQVFFGHCHMSVSGNMNGIPVCGIESLFYQALPNFTDDRFLDAPNLSPTYSLAVVDRCNLIVHRIAFEYSDEIVVSG
jgi:3',5'-cyclic AMP phosphodiesterase CpdA